jgi:hypothetical protein
VLPGFRGWATAKLAQAGRNGLTFGTTGAAQQYLQAEIEKEYYNPDAKWEPNAKEIAGQAIAGALLGMPFPLRTKAQEREPPLPRPVEGEIIPPAGRPSPGVPRLGAPGQMVEGTVNRPGVAQEAQRLLPGPEATQAVQDIQAAQPSGEVRGEVLPPGAGQELRGIVHDELQRRALGAAPEPAQGPLPADAHIVNPVGGTAWDKIAQLNHMTAENRPFIQNLFRNIDDQFGTESVDNVKDPNTLLGKAWRPSVLEEKPYHDVEHVRDSYRGKTLVDSVHQIAPIIDYLQQNGINIVKADTEKQFNPKAFGFRISAFDLRLPNRQLFEYYIPVREMDSANNEGGAHLLYENWRKRDLTNLTPAEVVDYYTDVAKANGIFRDAWKAYLDRSGDDESALRASLSRVSASGPSTVSKEPAPGRPNVASAGNLIPGIQRPSLNEAAQPSRGATTSITSTSPLASRITDNLRSIVPASESNIGATRAVGQRPAPFEIDAPTRHLLAQEGVTYRLGQLRPENIKADPARFQYKPLTAKAADVETGHTGTIKPMKPGWQQRAPMMVYRDRNGQDFILDGHHRLVLAKNLAKTDPNLRINAIILHESNMSPGEAKELGQRRNEAREAWGTIEKQKALGAERQGNIFRATAPGDTTPASFRPEDPDADHMLNTANGVARNWQSKLGTNVRVVMGGSLVSRTLARTDRSKPVDMDVRFLTDNPERDYPKIEAATGLKLRKVIDVDEYPSGKSKGYLVEGPLTSRSMSKAWFARRPATPASRSTTPR